MKLILICTLLLTMWFTASPQNFKDTASKSQVPTYTYAYITVAGKGFGKKLKVEVDFGDTPEQVTKGEQYSETLTNKKSYAAILNYMSDKGYEFVESKDYSFSFQGTGGSAGIIFIMRTKESNISKE